MDTDLGHTSVQNGFVVNVPNPEYEGQRLILLTNYYGNLGKALLIPVIGKCQKPHGQVSDLVRYQLERSAHLSTHDYSQVTHQDKSLWQIVLPCNDAIFPTELGKTEFWDYTQISGDKIVLQKGNNEELKLYINLETGDTEILTLKEGSHSSESVTIDYNLEHPSEHLPVIDAVDSTPWWEQIIRDAVTLENGATISAVRADHDLSISHSGKERAYAINVNQLSITLYNHQGYVTMGISGGYRDGMRFYELRDINGERLRDLAEGKQYVAQIVRSISKKDRTNIEANQEVLQPTCEYIEAMLVSSLPMAGNLTIKPVKLNRMPPINQSNPAYSMEIGNTSIRMYQLSNGEIIMNIANKDTNQASTYHLITNENRNLTFDEAKGYLVKLLEGSYGRRLERSYERNSITQSVPEKFIAPSILRTAEQIMRRTDTVGIHPIRISLTTALNGTNLVYSVSVNNCDLSVHRDDHGNLIMNVMDHNSGEVANYALKDEEGNNLTISEAKRYVDWLAAQISTQELENRSFDEENMAMDGQDESSNELNKGGNSAQLEGIEIRKRITANTLVDGTGNPVYSIKLSHIEVSLRAVTSGDIEMDVSKRDDNGNYRGSEPNSRSSYILRNSNGMPLTIDDAKQYVSQLVSQVDRPFISNNNESQKLAEMLSIEEIKEDRQYERMVLLLEQRERREQERREMERERRERIEREREERERERNNRNATDNFLAPFANTVSVLLPLLVLSHRMNAPCQNQQTQEPEINLCFDAPEELGIN